MAVLLAGSYDIRAAHTLCVLLACFGPCSIFRAGRVLSVAQAVLGTLQCCARIRVVTIKISAFVGHRYSEIMHISLQFNLINYCVIRP